MLTDLVPYEEINGWYCYFDGSGIWQIKDGFWVPKGEQPPNDSGESSPCDEITLNRFWDKDYFHFLGQEITLPARCAGCDRLNIRDQDYLCQECRNG